MVYDVSMSAISEYWHFFYIP